MVKVQYYLTMVILSSAVVTQNRLNGFSLQCDLVEKLCSLPIDTVCQSNRRASNGLQSRYMERCLNITLWIGFTLHDNGYYISMDVVSIFISKCNFQYFNNSTLKFYIKYMDKNIIESLLFFKFYLV